MYCGTLAVFTAWEDSDMKRSLMVLATGAWIVTAACGDSADGTGDSDAGTTPVADGGGGSGDASTRPDGASPDAGPPVPTFAIAVTVTGLAGLDNGAFEAGTPPVPVDGGDAGPSTPHDGGPAPAPPAGAPLVLSLNGGGDLTVAANGTFAFTDKLASGAAFDVQVKTQPGFPSHECSVSGGTGTVASGDVATIAVTCDPTDHTVGGTVTGLAGSGLVVANDGVALPINANGSFAFPGGPVPSGTGYDVRIVQQPANPQQTCAIAGGRGYVGASNVTSVAITCTTNRYKVGGTLAGLQGTGLVLQNNAGDDLTLNAGQNGAFSFATSVPSGGAYAVTVKTQPTGVAGEECSVTAGTGTVGTADVTSVAVSCVATKKVFVSSALYTGDLGGLDGADAKCQALASAANLGGTYRAWLSDTTGSPSTRFTQSTVPYVLVDGTKIADNWADLTDGNLAATISKTETGGAAPQGSVGCPPGNPTVWSATTASGTLASAGLTCSNWSSTNGGSYWGRTTATDSSFTAWCSGGICSWTAPIYCFQQ